MTFREALVHAVDRLRSEGCEDPGDRACANMLERKAERLRAKSEAPAVWEHRCYCGERRAANRLICVECHREVPAKILLRWHTGNPSQREHARQTIITICQTRIGVRGLAA